MDLKLIPAQSKKEWEDFILRHSPHSLFQSWYWGEVQKKAHQKVLRFIIMQDAEMTGVVQIFIVRARRGTYLHLRHGPIFIRQEKALWKELLRQLEPIARKESAWFLRVSPLIDNSEDNRRLLSELGLRSAPIHEVDAERCWVLDIDKPENQLLSEMRKTTRYEIRRSMKMDLSLDKTDDITKIKNFLKLYAHTTKRHGFVGHSAITEEFEIFVKEKKAMLFLCSDHGVIMAGAIILYYGNQAIYHHGASVSNKIPASYLIQWRSILEAKSRGIKLYNFYGIAPENKPNHPWRGITLFKKGFGGREISYIHAHDFAFSPLYIIPKTIESIRTTIRGY